MNIVLFEPEIPPNTGNVARLCAATNTTLHLIEPLGFRLDDSQLKRAGMDYWLQVRWHRWKNWTEFRWSVAPDSNIWFVESNGPSRYDTVEFHDEDYIVFGRETAGLPPALLHENRGTWLRIPMFNPQSRSLNLSNCVALVLFEALRQNNFKSELPPP